MPTEPSSSDSLRSLLLTAEPKTKGKEPGFAGLFQEPRSYEAFCSFDAFSIVAVANCRSGPMCCTCTSTVVRF